MDEWKQDFDEDFCNIAELPPTMVEHMRNAVHVSYYKYGTVLTKDPDMLKSFYKKELQKFNETGNTERVVNACNYDMFLYMITGDTEYIGDAIQLKELYSDEKYVATDSNQSVTEIKKPVSEWLRERIYNDK